MLNSFDYFLEVNDEPMIVIWNMSWNNYPRFIVNYNTCILHYGDGLNVSTPTTSVTHFSELRTGESRRLAVERLLFLTLVVVELKQYVLINTNAQPLLRRKTRMMALIRCTSANAGDDLLGRPEIKRKRDKLVLNKRLLALGGSGQDYSSNMNKRECVN